jgi:hypothetical protein
MGDYTSVQDAINDTNVSADTVLVYPGLYQENILINRSVTLKAYDGPLLTCIDGSLHTMNNAQPDTIVVNSNLTDVRIIGFCLTGGQNGLLVKTSSTVLVANCVAQGNTVNGFSFVFTQSTTPPTITLHNNVLVSNGGSGVFMTIPTTFGLRSFFPCDIRNNIFASNTRYGIEANVTSNFEQCQLLHIDYNDYSGNISGDYSSGIGTGQCVVPGPGEKHASPGFVGSAIGAGVDVRLLSNSQCRNAGDPAAIYEDPDGTRCDMGAYGGPESLTFYEQPNDGPVIKNVVIMPGSVPKGGTFTIHATGSVR